MTEPSTPLPSSKAFGEDESSKLEGVSDEEARRAACPPSVLTLLGLVRHMTDVERWWFRRVRQAEDIPGLFDDEAEWDVPEGTPVSDALTAYWDEIAVVDSYLGSASMDEFNTPGTEGG